MKNQLSRLLAPAALAGTALLALSVSTSAAFAQTASTSSGATSGTTAPQASQPLLGFSPAPVVVNIDNSGNALIRGTVQSVSTSTITLVSWGGVWTVNTARGTQVYSNRSNALGNVDAIAVGDFVGVEGAIILAQGASVNATVVRDWTTNPITTVPLGMSGTGTASNTSGTSAATTGTTTAASGSSSTTINAPTPATSTTTSGAASTNTSPGAGVNTTGTSGSITPGAYGSTGQTSPGIPVTSTDH